VQASTETVSTHRVAKQMLALWHFCLSDASRLYALLEELRIGLTDMKLLHHLSAEPDPLTVKELAERMGLSLPGASRAADALLKRGWLSRQEDEHDRRMKRLAITAGGRDVLRRVEEARMAGLEDVIADVPTVDLDRLSKAIDPILARLEERKNA
jgi:DNA-binding MarR family transcriptional regulator